MYSGGPGANANNNIQNSGGNSNQGTRPGSGRVLNPPQKTMPVTAPGNLGAVGEGGTAAGKPDADLLEVKWMANHIQRHMAQTGSHAQHA